MLGFAAQPTELGFTIRRSNKSFEGRKCILARPDPFFLKVDSMNFSKFFRQVMIVGLATLVGGCVTAPSNEMQKFSFRGRAFNSPPSKEMIKQENTGYSPFFAIDKIDAITEYRIPNEVMLIGLKKLERVSYIYLNERLIRIDIAFLNDRACSSARNIVPSIEEQYKIRLTQTSDVTKFDVFVAKAEEADIRISSVCWRDRNDWVSALTFDYIPGYSIAEKIAKSSENRREQMQINLDRKGL